MPTFLVVLLWLCCCCCCVVVVLSCCLRLVVVVAPRHLMTRLPFVVCGATFLKRTDVESDLQKRFGTSDFYRLAATSVFRIIM